MMYTKIADPRLFDFLEFPKKLCKDHKHMPKLFSKSLIMSDFRVHYNILSRPPDDNRSVVSIIE